MLLPLAIFSRRVIAEEPLLVGLAEPACGLPPGLSDRTSAFPWGLIYVDSFGGLCRLIVGAVDGQTSGLVGLTGLRATPHRGLSARHRRLYQTVIFPANGKIR